MQSRERGSVTIETMLAIGLILIPAAAMLAQLPGWIATSHASQVAAVEAARQVALAGNMTEGVGSARKIAEDVIINHGLDSTELKGVVVNAKPAGELQRGQIVIVTVTVQGRPIVVPGIGTVGNPFDAVSSATERVDDYRSFGP